MADLGEFTTVSLTGIEELDANLQYFGEIAQRKIGGRVVMKMASIAARGIRSQIRPTIRQSILAADKGIGARRIKRSDKSPAIAKVGIGVGRARKNALAVRVANRGRRKGVGVSALNLHWFALGTGPRFTGARTKGRGKRKRLVKTGKPRVYTGRIAKSKWGGFVQRGIQATQSEALNEARSLGERLIAEEQAKLDPHSRPVFTV
jgi:hypothetical protein